MHSHDLFKVIWAHRSVCDIHTVKGIHYQQRKEANLAQLSFIYPYEAKQPKISPWQCWSLHTDKHTLVNALVCICVLTVTHMWHFSTFTKTRTHCHGGGKTAGSPEGDPVMREGAGGQKFGVCEAGKVGSHFWGSQAHMGKETVSRALKLCRKCQITAVWSWGRMHSYKCKWARVHVW